MTAIDPQAPHQSSPTNSATGALASVTKTLPGGTAAAILIVLATVLMLWALAIVTFGYAGFILPLVGLVPVLVATLILITWG